jgi:hypothetical protein
MQYVKPQISIKFESVLALYPDWEKSGAHRSLPLQAFDYKREKKQFEAARRMMLKACVKAAIAEQFPNFQNGDEIAGNVFDLAAIVIRVDELFAAATSET